MSQQVPKTGLSRRSFVKATAASAAVGLLLPSFGRSAFAQPKKGGVLRIGVGHGSTADTFDPGVLTNLHTQILAGAIHNYLVEPGDNGKLVPELAESWNSSDATTWVFKIRKGVTFHSGKSLTVDDVIASINYHRGDKSTSGAAPFVATIVDIKADGQNAIFTLKSANADFPSIMTDFHIPILPSADGKINPLGSDGCGGYVVDSFEPGVSSTLKRNTSYWKTDRAHFDRIEILTIHDSAARINALMTGEVDVIDRVDPSMVSLLKGRGNVNIQSIASPAHYLFAMDSRSAPLNDNNARLALKYGIDRQELVDKILYGHGSVSNDNPISPASRYFYKDLEAKPYDPDKAKFYLKKAGLDQLEVALSVADAGWPGAVDAAVLYSDKAAAAGIKITVDQVPNDGYAENIWMKKPFVASYWGGRIVEDQMFSMAYARGAPWNETFWSNDRFEELLPLARGELDQDKRRDMYYEMQRLVSFEGASVIPMYNDFVNALSEKVQTPEIVGNWGNLDAYRCAERWWFA